MKRASKQVRAARRRKSRHIRPQVAKTAIVPRPTVAEAIEKVLIGGDLTNLSTEQRLEYYNAVCKSLGLNPLTRPFDYIAFRATENAPAKMILYARKDCTEQLRKIHGIAIIESSGAKEDGLYIVNVKAQDKHGRTDTGTGCVSIEGLKGKNLANAIMIAETKAKRRATLSMAGLGFLDESELDGLDSYGTLTPGGRIMTIAPAENAHLSKFEEREPEQFAKYNSEQKKIVERKLAEAESGSLFYQLTDNGTYEITGDLEIKKANRDLLGPLYVHVCHSILASPEQLGKLISQFEDRKVPFKEIREPGM
jgi:hypothetical protein